MSFMDTIKKSYQEAKEQKQVKHSAYTEEYEKEKERYKKDRKKAKKKRQEYQVERAKEKAKRDVRNPLYKRLAKKAGAITKKSVEYAAAEIGKQAGIRREEKQLLKKTRRKARMGELTKIVAKKEIEKVRAKSQRSGFGKPMLNEGMGDILGTKKAKRNPILGMTPLGSSKQKSSSILGSTDVLGLNKPKKKKPNYF